MNKNPSVFQQLKKVFIGEAKSPFDRSVFHNISLIAFFAWVGLGADGLSSSCYGPAEAFITLGRHYFLGLIVAVATAATIFIISESYSQIVELFPGGGGGYFVASKLLAPSVGMVSGAALLVDYILTITLSVASGTDALLSFLPHQLVAFKLALAITALVILILLNLRGVKESVAVLMPIFLVFVFTHAFMIISALAFHFRDFPSVVHATKADVSMSMSELGFFGMLLLIMRAYSMGAGTYTGIEAVSNGMVILREPRVATAKRTMKYMMISLASVVLGIMISYALYRVEPTFGKTLNAVLFDKIAGGWGVYGYLFILITLISEAAILLVAAQAGFIDGPRVLSNMAADRWLPKRFTLLSDRLVTMNGILIMGIGSLVLMMMTNGSVGFLIVLYSINVFITFCLSQLGMVRHWWQVRGEKGWKRKILVNGVGFCLCAFILTLMTVMKFHEGGWITIFITGALVVFMFYIKRNYEMTDKKITELDRLISAVSIKGAVREIPICREPFGKVDPKAKTAVFLVKDFRGIGIQTIFNFFKSFGGIYKNFIFVQVGLIDATSFKSQEDVDKVKNKVCTEATRYADLLQRHGYPAETMCFYGTDTVDEISKAAIEVLRKYPNATFFGGQVVFPDNPIVSWLLHNETLFATQHRLYKEGVPLFIIPIVV